MVNDGNEKLYRYFCAKPLQRINGENGQLNQVVRCINNPSRGNQRKTSSQMCHLHENDKESLEIVERMDISPITRNWSKLIESLPRL